MARSWTVIRAKPIRSTTAAARPIRIAFLRCSGARAAGPAASASRPPAAVARAKRGSRMQTTIDEHMFARLPAAPREWTKVLHPRENAPAPGLASSRHARVDAQP